MTLAPWRSPLSRALHRNRSLAYARYLQLATVKPNGRPANRTVVFRGFLEETNQLKFVTDARSTKCSDIEASPWGEVCWYFPTTREQFRLAGALQLISASTADAALLKARQTSWQELSGAARLQFCWPDPAQFREPIERFNPAAPDATQPVANFCLLLLNPDQVDHLELRGEPQNRYLYQRDEAKTWSVQAVNP